MLFIMTWDAANGAYILSDIRSISLHKLTIVQLGIFSKMSVHHIVVSTYLGSITSASIITLISFI